MSYPSTPNGLDEPLAGGIDAAIRAGSAIAEHTFHAATDTPGTQGTYLHVVPDGYKVVTTQVDDERLLPCPRRKTGTVVVRDAASFLAYFGKHAPLNAEVFADDEKGTVTAVLNAHGGVGGDAQWQDHRLVLRMVPSPAWVAWTDRSGKYLPQVEFAEFIEANLPDIAEPPAAAMLELAQTFEATKSVDFESSHRLSSGERRLEYKETLAAKAGQRGQIDIPTQITLGLAPWRGGDVYRVTARFRYRIADGRLLLGYVLDRPEDVLDAAFREICSQIADELDGRPLLHGLPS